METVLKTIQTLLASWPVVGLLVVAMVYMGGKWLEHLWSEKWEVFKTARMLSAAEKKRLPSDKERCAMSESEQMALRKAEQLDNYLKV